MYKSKYVEGADINLNGVAVRQVFMRANKMRDSIIALLDKNITVKDDGRVIIFNSPTGRIIVNKDFLSKVDDDGRNVVLMTRGGVDYFVERVV